MAILGASSLRPWFPSSVLMAEDSRAAAAAAVATVGGRGWMRHKKSSWAWLVVPVYCTPVQQNPTAQQETYDQTVEETVEDDGEGVGIMCEPCHGRGWLLCNFCKGQKTNVKAENNRIYRRCPDCRGIGYILCSKCKVFKCVTYPDYSDGEL